MFTFSSESHAVLLEDTFKGDYLKGLLCPDIDKATLTFNLTSDLLGNTTETLSIPIERP